MSKPWKRILMSMCVLSIGISLIGCSNANKVKQQAQEGAHRLEVQMTNDDHRNLPGKQANMNDAAAKASQLADRAQLVNGVKSANVQLYGNDALVGIEVENSGKRGIIEKQVYSALRIQYPAYRLHVTSDQSLSDRIKVQKAGAESNDSGMRSMSNDMSALIKAIDKSFHSRK
ncbi:YhcN/YlaJ family sporulation lipoprotein [Paenibacillus sp. YIM B09110]|uniref:YhcN/YlaJ family sporulation lipoprotein n=1 Tax=Paenibacillus sp. YIM B09110 TaxID=3126102 RepID=UPI00301C6788